MKTKVLRKKIVEMIRDLIYKIQVEDKIVIGNKILITSTDGLGDFIVREKLFVELLSKYGKENIFVLVKSGLESLVMKYGVPKENIITFTKEYRTKICKSKELLLKINKLGINKIYSLERALHDLWFMKYFTDIKKICFRDCWRCESATIQSYYDEIIKIEDKEVESITEQTMWHIEKLFNKKYTLEEVRPEISEYYGKNDKYSDSIAFGIGSIDRKKMMYPKKLIEILKAIREKYPEINIYLLGIGKLENKLISQMLEIKDDSKIIDLIGKTSLEECNEIINSCKLFVGMDSGLYNTAFGMKKKTIGLFSTIDTPFAHKGAKDVIVIEGHGGEPDYFGTTGLNGIEVDKVRAAVEEYLR